MSKQDLLKTQSCVLKVNIHCHCDGCEQKVKKLLQKIDGVYSVKVDANEGKVVVAGDVDPDKLIKKLKRAGKHAEIWGGQKGMMVNQNYPIINPQFQNLQLGNGKGGKDNNKSQNQKGQKGSGGSQGQELAQFQNVKGVQDLKVPAKEQNHKSVKFMLPEEEFDASDDDFDEYGDNFDDDDDDEEGEEEGLGHGHGHGHPMNHNKMMPIMGDGRGPHGLPAAMMNGPAFINHKDNVGGGRDNGSVKKGDVIDQAMLIKGKGGNYNEAKNDNNGEKKSGQKVENLNNKGDKPKGGGGGDGIKKKSGKSENGLLGRFLGFGKKSKKVELEDATYTNKSKNQNNVGGDNKGKEGKKREGKLEDHTKNSKHDFDFEDFDDYDDIDSPPHHKNGKTGKGNNNGKEDQMGPSPIVGNYPMGHQRENIPAVQGLPAMTGGSGYNQGMQMQHAPYNNNLQQQQYMAMMMNQQHHQHQQANMNNNMYPNAMMYGGRPHPSMNYMPPPPMPAHPMADPITHTFSDENVESCSIM